MEDPWTVMSVTDNMVSTEDCLIRQVVHQIVREQIIILKHYEVNHILTLLFLIFQNYILPNSIYNSTSLNHILYTFISSTGYNLRSVNCNVCNYRQFINFLCCNWQLAAI